MGCAQSSPVAASPDVAKKTDISEASSAPPAPASDPTSPSSSFSNSSSSSSSSSSTSKKDSEDYRIELSPQVQPLKERYTMGKILGVGGFGEVRLAIRKTDGKHLAIKKISKIKFRGDKERDLMVNEVKLMYRVRGCEYVVELIEWAEDLANFYMVVELCEGGELMTRIIEAEHFSERVAATYFQQMCLGLKHVHEKLVVHRDIKPENFLLDSKEQHAKVKLTDFGLSIGIPSPDTVLDEACGSAYYIAPEMFKGEYTKEADIFSLGVNLFLMLSGTVPFGAEANSDAQIYKAIKHDPLVFGPEWENSTAAIKELLMGLLEKDPTKRYTLVQALNHPWVTGVAASTSKVDAKVISSLISFNRNNKFKKNALNLIASTFEASEVAMLREQFIKIDQDNSGQINLAELRAAIEKTGQKNGESINTAIANIDVDGDGSISYEEFLAAVIERQLIHRQNKVWWAFCEYDQDSDGKITVSELKKALTEQGVIKEGETTKETNEKVASYIAEYDLNGDGVIDYEEFMKMLLPKDTKYKIKPDS